MMTGPQQPSGPQRTLTSDWHLWSCTTSRNSASNTTTALKLSAEGELLSPNKANTPHLSHRLIPLSSLCIDTKHDPGRPNDLQRREEKSVARQLCLYRLWAPLKGSYGWQEEEEERWEDVGRTVVAWHMPLWLSVRPCCLADGIHRAV